MGVPVVSFLYKGLSLLVSLVGGMIAVKLFNQMWKKVRGEQHAPDARDLDRGWREVLLAAGAQGALYGLVKAATRRAAAKSVRKDLAKYEAKHPPGGTAGKTRAERPRVHRARTERVPAGHRGR